MKILKAGKLPQERLYQASCSNCGCEVEYKREEATLDHNPKDGEFLYLLCPTARCGNILKTVLGAAK